MGFEILDESKYPGYKEKLVAIQKEHPNWSFTILYTGLNWSDVIYNESGANYITENYIQKGQDTLYLEKFDVIEDEKTNKISDFKRGKIYELYFIM